MTWRRMGRTAERKELGDGCSEMRRSSQQRAGDPYHILICIARCPSNIRRKCRIWSNRTVSVRCVALDARYFRSRTGGQFPRWPLNGCFFLG